jgi:hypothetical protein
MLSSEPHGGVENTSPLLERANGRAGRLIIQDQGNTVRANPFTTFGIYRCSGSTTTPRCSAKGNGEKQDCAVTNIVRSECSVSVKWGARVS